MNEFYHAGQLNQPSLFDTSETTVLTKFCAGCEQEKSVTEFHKMKSTSDGYRPSCKQCRRDRIENPAPIVQKPLFLLSRKCTKCRKEKAIEEFCKMAKGKCGYHSQCRDCQSEYNQGHRADNLEYYREQGRIKNAKPETKVQRTKRHRERMVSDPNYIELRKLSGQRYYQNHVTEHRERYYRYQARKMNATVEKVDYQRILERDGCVCYICSQPIDTSIKKGPARLEFDHVIPLAPRPGEPQGSHSEDNIRPTHRRCNRTKWNRPLSELTDYDRRGVD